MQRPAAHPGVRPTRQRRLRVVLGLCLVLASGCSLMDRRTASSDGSTGRSFGFQPSWAQRRLRMDDVSIAGVQGPEERRLRSVARERLAHDTELAPAELKALFVELEAAQRLYDEKRYAEAEQAFKALANKSAPKKGITRGLFNRHQFDIDPQQSPIEEDALFMLAQSRFQQGKLAGAEESYSALLARYPSTRHLDTVSRQLFRIAREWLGFPDQQDSEFVQVAYGEKAPSLEQRQQGQGTWFPNFRDKTRPAFDPEGHALEALKLIWLHDAAGPLADDALMMAANYHLKRGNYIDAAQHYRLLQEQFPDSPHFKDSLMLGSHVLLASYNGPAYDPSPLEEAKKLKQMALQYQDIAPEDRQRIEEELDKIAEAEVEPLWKEIEFYIAKRQTEAIILHCNYLINTHPHSKYARMAAAVKADYEGKPRSAIRWPAINPSTPAARPAAQPPARTPAFDGAQDLTATPDSSNAPKQTAPSAPPQEPRRMFDRFLRRADQPPNLQPVQPSPSPAPSPQDPYDVDAIFRPPTAQATPEPEPAAGRVRL